MDAPFEVFLFQFLLSSCVAGERAQVTEKHDAEALESKLRPESTRTPTELPQRPHGGNQGQDAGQSEARAYDNLTSRQSP